MSPPLPPPENFNQTQLFALNPSAAVCDVASKYKMISSGFSNHIVKAAPSVQ